MSVNIRTRRIISVKFSKSNNQVVINLQDWNETAHNWDNITRKIKETPAPEFVEALSALSECICSACAFPYEWANEITVTGFTRKYDSDDNVSAAFRGYRTLEGSNCPLILNPPFTAIIPEKDTGEFSVPVGRMDELLKVAVEAALGFLDGKRGQATFEFPESDGEPTPDEVPGEGFHDIDPAKPAKPKKRKPARTAKGKGDQAREDDKEMSHNPFDQKSEYDAYTSWNLGWQEADERIRREAAAEAPEPEGEATTAE